MKIPSLPRFGKPTSLLIAFLLLTWIPSFQAQTPVTAPNAGSSAASTVADFEQAKQTFPNFRTESAAEFEKIKNYHEELANEGIITNSFQTADGKLIHCIEIGSQRSVRSAGLKPAEIRIAPVV